MSSAIAPPPVFPSESRLDDVRSVEAALAGSRRAAPARRGKSLLALAAFGALEATAGVLGASVNAERKNMAWYRALSKPRRTPPEGIFGIVWPVLYTLSAASAWRVWRAPESPSRTVALAAWGAQLVTNAAWTPLFFGAKRPRLALVDVGLLGASLAGFAVASRKVDRGAAALTLPYLAWVAFAGTLNASIIRRNRSGLRRFLARG